MLLATLLVGAAVAAPTTGPATNVTNATATLTGTVTGDAEVYFQYGTTTAYGLTTPRQNVEAGAVQAPVTGLTSETTYHYRLVAVGETPGDDETFTTTANPQPPAIANQHSREITPDAATTTATVNANGSATMYAVEWGPTTRYGSQTAAASAGNGRTPTAVDHGATP